MEIIVNEALKYDYVSEEIKTKMLKKFEETLKPIITN